MKGKKMSLCRSAVAGMFKAFLAVSFLTLCASYASATTTSRNLTVTLAPAAQGIIVVDQQFGTVDLCVAGGAGNLTAHCVKIGKASPSSLPPTPALGLTVVLGEQNSPFVGDVGVEANGLIW